jgi:hypothetical protein
VLGEDYFVKTGGFFVILMSTAIFWNGVNAAMARKN